MSRYELKRAPQKAQQEGSKAGQHTSLAVSINGPNDGHLVNQRPIGEVSSIGTYLLKVQIQKLAKDKWTEANARPVD